MFDPETLIVFSLAALVMNISPGPSNFYVMSRTMGQGWSAGVTAALPCDLFVAWSSQKVMHLVTGNRTFARAQSTLSGVILIALGLFVALSERPR